MILSLARRAHFGLPSTMRNPPAEPARFFLNGTECSPRGRHRPRAPCRFGQVAPPEPAAALGRAFAPGLVNQDPPHRLGRGRKEVSAALPFRRPVRIDEA